MDAAHPEAGTSPRSITSLVEPSRDLLDSDGAALAVTFAIEAEYQFDGLGLDWVDDDLLLDPDATLLDLRNRVAKGKRRPIVEAGSSVLLHCSENVLTVLATLVLVEKRNDLTHHDLCGIVAEFLSDRDQANADLSKFAHEHFERKRIAEKPRVGVDDDAIVGMIVVGRPFDHFLELGPVVVHRRGAGFNIMLCECPTLCQAEGSDLATLVGNREIRFRLPAGRDTIISAARQVFSDTFRYYP